MLYTKYDLFHIFNSCKHSSSFQKLDDKWTKLYQYKSYEGNQAYCLKYDFLGSPLK